MTKQDISERILMVLQDTHFGLNLQKITEKIQCSRTTVTKYLKKLEAEGRVVDRKLGQYHLWLPKEAFNAINTQKIPGNALIFSIFRSIISSLEKRGFKPADFKQLGQQVAEDFNFSDYFEKENIDVQRGISDFRSVADRLMRSIDSISQYYDSYKWHPPIVREEKLEIILRMGDSELITLIPQFYHLVAGIIENVIKKIAPKNIAPVRVEVIQIQEKEKIVDFQFEFGSNN